MIPRITSMEEYETAYRQSMDDPDSFWASIAEEFHWHEKWQRVHSGDFFQVNYKWFEGGKLNLSENCLDRHLKSSSDKIALLWEPNDPHEKERRITYRQLYEEVCRFANVLKNADVKKGDPVCIYLPMIPELAVAMLACARIGAIHMVVFGGFSSQSLSSRMQDAGCKLLITADGFYRGNKLVELKKISDEALKECPLVSKVIVVRRSNSEIEVVAGRDFFWEQLITNEHASCPAEIMDAEDPLYILYTSGSTGKPKGLVHTTGGYMVYSGYSFLNVFQYREHDVYWCTADIGWVTGHTYVVYGPFLNAATVVMYEGIPSYPDFSRWWNIIDKYGVNIFYTAPTAIRSFEAQGTDHLKNAGLKSLRVLGTVGEPINEEAWEWFFKNIGKEHCPVVDTWWQTETGGILISPLAGITPLKPSYATLPLPGISPVIVDNNGTILRDPFVEGNLCIQKSWPSQARTTYNDHQRFIQTYFSAYPGLYFTGDGCRRDQNGYYRITGRVDDVLKISGHRIGTAEIENAINEHENIVESAVVGIPHEIKGEGIVAFVICEHPEGNEQQLQKEVIELISRTIGPIAKPERVIGVSGLPKTRSGKIMRRILRKIAEGNSDQIGDISTLLNPEIVNEIVMKWNQQ